MLFADTDSLTYEIKSEDIYEKFFKHKHLLDLSNYPKDSRFFDPVNEKLIGKMKDVCEGKINDEFVGWKSKKHSMKNIDDKKSNKAKGVNTATEFNEFKDTLFNEKQSDTKWKEFKVKNIKLEHVKSTKYHYRVLIIKDLF